MDAGRDAPPSLVGLRADPELLSRPEAVPHAAGHPADPRLLGSRDRIVGTGAALTGVALIGGAALTVAGLVDLIAEGGLLGVVGLVIGLVLVLTHWGWVHVAEATADRLQRGLDLAASDENAAWLRDIEPVSRFEVTTRSAEDGSVLIERVRFRPVARTPATFSFERETELTERHSGDEPGEAIAERAELLRREAARATEEARAEYEVELGLHERRELAAEDDRERDRLRAAESEALSEQINARLRDPPLSE